MTTQAQHLLDTLNTLTPGIVRPGKNPPILVAPDLPEELPRFLADHTGMGPESSYRFVRVDVTEWVRDGSGVPVFPSPVTVSRGEAAITEFSVTVTLAPPGVLVSAWDEKGPRRWVAAYEIEVV